MTLLCWGLEGASPGAAGETAAAGTCSHVCGTAQAASSPLCLQEGLWELLLGFSTSGTMGGFAAFWPEGCPCAVSRGCEAGGEQGRVAGVSPCTLCHSDSLP